MRECSGVRMKKQTEYKIGEVASLLGINTSVLRFWEKEFPWIVPKRTEKKHRVYTEKSIQKVRVIQNLLYDKGMTIEGAKKLLATKLHEKNQDMFYGIDMPEELLDGGQGARGKAHVSEHSVDAIIEELEELRTMLSITSQKK